MFIITAANTLGSVVIITVFLHYFIAVIVAVAIGYLYLSVQQLNSRDDIAH
jgi:hypothetical protein